MATRPVLTTLNGRTIDILNTIRANAPLEYQNLVPEVTQASDIPKVGEVLFGYPAMANQFITALMNRIALVQMNNMQFNNLYAGLKKGVLSYGETVEEIFTDLIKAQHFDPEKAEKREFKRYLPKVHTAFHIMNYRAQYPLTVQDSDLRQAFTSADGVERFIMNLIDSIYRSAEYDEYLLFKYLLIKAISSGKMYPRTIGSGDMKNAAVQFRSISNLLEFPSSKYNAYGVRNNTKKSKQAIFMDAEYNSAYDVNVLASAFNMDKADFMGRLYLIDNWTEFDSERFEIIMEESDGFEPVTADELALCADVKAVLVDTDWFQVYDNLNRMGETRVESGMYWNYFYNVWKTVSSSPFANAVVFVADTADTNLPSTITAKIVDKIVSPEATTFVLKTQSTDASFIGDEFKLLQSEDATRYGIAVRPYGGVTFATGNNHATTLKAEFHGAQYNAGSTLGATANVGTTITFTKVASSRLSVDAQGNGRLAGLSVDENGDGSTEGLSVDEEG